MTHEPIDVDTIIATIPEKLWDPGDDPWSGANLISCGSPPCCTMGTFGNSLTTPEPSGMVTPDTPGEDLH